MTLFESIYLANPKQTRVNMKRMQFPGKEQYQEKGKYQHEIKMNQFAGAANQLMPFNNTDISPLQTYLLCTSHK